MLRGGVGDVWFAFAGDLRDWSSFLRISLTFWLSMSNLALLAVAHASICGIKILTNVGRLGPFIRKLHLVLYVEIVKFPDPTLSVTLMTSLQTWWLVSLSSLIPALSVVEDVSVLSMILRIPSKDAVLHSILRFSPSFIVMVRDGPVQELIFFCIVFSLFSAKGDSVLTMDC